MIKILLILLFAVQSTPSQVCGKNEAQWHKENIKISERQYTSMTRLDYPMLLDKQDQYVSGFINSFGGWGTSIYPFLTRFLKPGYKIMNIGSQSGIQALFMSRAVGDKGKVFIFQPFSISYNIIRKSSFLNLFQNTVILNNIAISNKFDKQYMIINKQNTGMARVYNESIFLQKKQQCDQNIKCSYQEIITGKVDDLVPKDTSFDFALIDVQRLQVQALYGMRQVIKRSPNLLIYVEWGYGDNQYQNIKLTKQLILFFYELKYKFYIAYSQDDCLEFKLKRIGAFEQFSQPNKMYDLFLVPQTIQIQAFL